ncbi:hypothetical protein SS05631_c35040 [Sinorhizobium sp. CCBAU 05631]|nr:hypothetical protein SS05631_c35040 [Sinorhizobium sp. CCBAU 05631]
MRGARRRIGQLARRDRRHRLRLQGSRRGRNILGTEAAKGCPLASGQRKHNNKPRRRMKNPHVFTPYIVLER